MAMQVKLLLGRPERLFMVIQVCPACVAAAKHSSKSKAETSLTIGYTVLISNTS
jgi:hypothetical protein